MSAGRQCAVESGLSSTAAGLYVEIAFLEDRVPDESHVACGRAICVWWRRSERLNESRPTCTVLHVVQLGSRHGKVSADLVLTYVSMHTMIWTVRSRLLCDP